VVPSLGTAAWDLFRASAAQPSIHALVRQLCVALAAHDGPLIVVLDDYHCLLHAAIHDMLRLLLAHLPPQITLLLTSRADPPVGLARLRLGGALTELRTADIRFTSVEIAAFFARIPTLALAPADVSQLEHRTEGWAAGLHLAALSLQHHDAAHRTAFLTEFSGTQAYVFDYLVEEVFRRQPAPLQTFLLQTAILSRFCGPLCAAVLEHPEAPAWLAAVEAANVFVIALDTRREWFRYHPLFRDVLLAWLARTEGSTGQALLHQRASAWYAQAGFPREAIAHALNAQAWPAAFQAMDPLMEGAAVYEYFVEWPRWVAAIPRSEFQTHPMFSVRLAWVLLFTGYIEVAEQLLDDAEAGARKDPLALPAGIVQVWRAMAWYWRRAVQQALEGATQALATLPEHATTLRAIATHVVGLAHVELGHAAAAREPLEQAHAALQTAAEAEPFFTLSAALGLGRAFGAQGQLQRAAALYRHVIDRCPPYLQGPAPYNEYGLLCYDWNDVATAEGLLREGLAVGQRSGRGRYWPNGLALLARVCWARGDIDQAQQLMDQAQAAAAVLGTPRAQEEMAAQQAWLRFTLGDVAAALNWLHTWVMPSLAAPLYVHYPSTLMAIRLQIATAGTLLPAAARDAALEHLAHLLSAAQQDQRILDQVALLVLTALGHAGHDDAAARGALTAALDLAEPIGCIRRIIDEGPRVHVLLRALRDDHAGLAPRSPRVRYLDQLLAAREPAPDPAAPSHPANPLSEREQEVLQLLAAGQTIPEIARQLIVSVHTARTHVKNIYAKLDAHNRVQALDQARLRQFL
jgi:LuxR family transcriptional regulator, maltose regulon positive regulatory protein